jgi:hypothetical protein
VLEPPLDPLLFSRLVSHEILPDPLLFSGVESTLNHHRRHQGGFHKGIIGAGPGILGTPQQVGSSYVLEELLNQMLSQQLDQHLYHPVD